MKKLRKFLVASVMTLSVIAMSGLTVAPAQAAASAGDLIKMDGLSSVYYLGDDGKRYVFPNEATYFSWYSDFSGVVTIPASELQSYPLGGNVTMRPGTTLVKITTDPSVYAVEPNGVLRKIANESQAAALYGTNWNKRIVDLADAFFTNYTIGQPLADGEVPAGSLVKNADSASVYYYDGTNYRSIASEAAMTANRFRFENVMTIANDITAGGSAVSAMEAALVDTAQGATGPGQVVTGSGLMVSLNSQTPASMNIPEDVSVEMLKLNLTAANDGPVNVSSITLTAYGLSEPKNITEAAFYDNGVRVGSTRSFNSDREATFHFSNPIYVAAGTTKTLTVRATASATGNYGIGIANAASIVSTGASVTGSFPVTGNIMSAVEATGVGELEITSINTAAGTTVSFGEADVLLADFELSANDETALIQSMSLYNDGTRDDSIVSNLQLYIDGNKVANGTYANRYATFNLNGFEIERGDSVTVELKGDVNISSANANINFVLRNTSDIIAAGKTHGFSLSVVGKDKINAVVNLTTGDVSMSSNKSVIKTEVKPDTDNVVIANFTIKSNGENATLLSLGGNTSGFNFELIQTGTTTRQYENVVLVDKSTSATYELGYKASSTVGTTLTTVLDLDEEIYLSKGVAKEFDVRVDVIQDAEEDTGLQVTLHKDALEIEGEESGLDIDDITPSEIEGPAVTITPASLDMYATKLTSLTVVPGVSNQVIYRATLEAGSADDVRLQSFVIEDVVGNAFTSDNITQLQVLLNGSVMSTISRITNKVANFSSLTNNVIKAGKEATLEIEASFSSSLEGNDIKLGNATTTARAVTGNKLLPVATSNTISREVAIATTGSLSVEMLKDDSKANKDSFLLAGSETEAGRYLGEIKFTTKDEAITVNKLALEKVGTYATTTNADIKSVKLVKADGTVVAEKTVKANADVEFDSFNVTFDADKSTSLFIVVSAKGMNVAGDPTSTATAGHQIAYTLDTLEAKGASSNDVLELTTGTLAAGKYTINTTIASNVATIVGSNLTSIVSVMSDGKLANGTRTIGEYKFVFNNGANRKANNDELKAVLERLVVNAQGDSTTTLKDVRVYVKGDSTRASNPLHTTADTIGNLNLTWAGTDLGTIGELDGEVTLVIEATVNSVPERGWLETSIELSGTNVVYNGHEVAGNILTADDKITGAHLAD